MSRSQEDVLRAVEYHHDQYIKNLRLLNELNIGAAGLGIGSPTQVRVERAGSSEGTPSPAVKATTFLHNIPRSSQITTAASDTFSLQSAPTKRGRRLTNDRGTLDKRPRASSILAMESESDDDMDDFLPLLSPSSTFSPRQSEDPASFACKPLLKEEFTEHDLVLHVQELHEAQPATVTALAHVFSKRDDVDAANVIEVLETDEEGLVSAHGTFEVYDVGKHGVAVPQHDHAGNEEDEMVDGASFWNTIKSVNTSGEVCGRMTILQEPSPVMLAGVHLTMRNHFDMDELFNAVVTTDSTKGKTKAYMNRAFEPEPLRRRSFFFVLRYHTVVGADLIPAPWQRYDHRPPDRRSPDHIDIAECSSVLALSLGGDPLKSVQVRKRKGAPQKGAIYDTLGPWHLLNIQYFPDNEHSMRSEDIKKPFYDGPYAFLDSLAVQYRDAVKRYKQLNELITKLITPPNEFMFDVKIRDKLLFEDNNFTYSRRYFWAYTTLGVINDGIKSMTAAYNTTFAQDFWEGRNQTLWPHPDPESAAGRAYIVRLQGLRHDIERAVRELHGVFDMNDQTRTEIRSLREQLFSGSSVKESRRAIEQGDNIKVLTGVSMVFLPLTFVTSVFGITEFTIAADDWRFPVTMVSVCVPFFILILVLQTRAGMDAMKKLGRLLDRAFRHVFGTQERRPFQHATQTSPSNGDRANPGAEGRGKKRMHRSKAQGLRRVPTSGANGSVRGMMQHRGDAASTVGSSSRTGRTLFWPWRRAQQDRRREKDGQV